MIVTLSPSKGQDFESVANTDVFTQAAMLADSKALMKILRKLDADDIQDLMSVSSNIAAQNQQRFSAFSTPFTLKNAKQSVLAFRGDVYKGLDVDSFSGADMAFAQQHVRMLSGLYGYLRPLDLIQAYRLEMKTALENTRGKNLYQFWDDKITLAINAELQQQTDPTLINLASNEYFKVVKPRLLEGNLLNISFKEVKQGKARVIAVFAKRARGMMTNFIVKNRIEKAADLQTFKQAGYRFSSVDSSDKQWVFVRPQP